MKRAGQVLLFVLGFGLVVWLVLSVGPDRILEVVRVAGPFFPVIVLCEMIIASTDFLAARALVGKKLPARDWARSTAVAYASSTLLPAGRAAGEAARTAILAPLVGAGRAAGACSRMQASALAANAAISAVGSLFVTSTALALALLGNGLVCATLAFLIFMLVRSERLAAWLKKRFKNFLKAHQGAPGEIPGKRASVAATLIIFVARLVQVTQYGLIVYAVAGKSSAPLAFSAHGIHLVGAAVGDVVPGQIGVTEGMFHTFATSLGIDVARALSIALIARASQLVVVVMCLPALLVKSEKGLGADRDVPLEPAVDQGEGKVDAKLGVHQLGNEEPDPRAD
jgi:uncharacterized membrane protein YbhN (UPF0104 family)